MSVHVHVRVFDYCMWVQGNCISRRSGGWIVMLLMMMMIELHVHSTHYLCLLHHHHPSCFLCDLYQMPDIGCLLISTMWFASYWSLRHHFSSVIWDRKWHQLLLPCPETGGVLTFWMTKERGRESKREEEMDCWWVVVVWRKEHFPI